MLDSASIVTIAIFMTGTIFNAGFTFYRLKDIEDDIRKIKKVSKTNRAVLYRLINELNTSKLTEFRFRYEDYDEED